jgi:hypothetical protein
MRIAIALMLLAGGVLTGLSSASALPAVPDRTAISGEAGAGSAAQTPLLWSVRARHSRWCRRRYNWTYYPYWRPYYYYYWQFYYPYGGPLF